MNPAYSLKTLDISDSSLGRFHTCERKFELAKLYAHNRSDSEGTLATDSGKCLHAAWQTYMSTNNREAGAWALLRSYPWHFNESQMSNYSPQSLYGVYNAMLDHPIGIRYQLATVNVNGCTRPAVEVPFRITFKNVSLFPDVDIPVRYIGFIDAVLYDTITGEYAVVDIKTTGKRRFDYGTMFKRSPQCLPYGYVLSQIAGQQVSSYDVHYFVAVIDAVAPKVYKYSFPKNTADIEGWAFNVAKDIRDIQLFAALGYFPRRGNACDTYYTCQYDSVCDYTDPTTVREYLDLMFGPVAPDTADTFSPWFELELTIPGF